MKKLLHMGTPLLTTYPSLADLSSILQNDSRFPAWLCNNFNQLIYFINKSKTSTYYTFLEDIPTERQDLTSSLPMYDYNKMLKTFNNIRYGKFTDFIVDCINNDYYIRTFIDNYDIMFHKYHYHNIHFIHAKMIYGYDEEAQLVYMSDFANGEKYSFFTASYDEVNNAYNDSLDKDNELTKYIMCLKVNDDINSVDVDYKLIEDSLLDYINSKDSTCRVLNASRWRNHYFTYGISCYDKIIEDIINNNVDIRGLNILYDHAVGMEYKINYLYSLHKFDSNETYKALSSKIIQIKKIALSNRNLYMKYRIDAKGNAIHKDNINKLVDKYLKLKEMSCKYTKYFLQALKYPKVIQEINATNYVLNMNENIITPESTWDKCIYDLPRKYYNDVNIEFDITPIKLSHIFFTGFAQKSNSINGFNDIPISFRLWEKIRCFEAYNGILDRQDAEVYPEMYNTYHIGMNIDLKNKRYDVYVTDPNNTKVQIAHNYKYREAATIPEYIDTMTFISVDKDDGFIENLKINDDGVVLNHMSSSLNNIKIYDQTSAFETLFKVVEDNNNGLIEIKADNNDVILSIDFNDKTLIVNNDITCNIDLPVNCWNRISLIRYNDDINILINDNNIIKYALSEASINSLNINANGILIHGSRIH